MTRKYTTNTTKLVIGDIAINIDYYNAAQAVQPNGCINWTGGKHRQGYGMYGFLRISTHKAGMNVVHRTAMMIKLNRELVKGEEVIHTCKNSLCINPAHLLLGDISTRMEYTKNIEKYDAKEIKFIVLATFDEIMARFNIKSKQVAASLRANKRNLVKKSGAPKIW
jgi:hypothetical protein